jgi:hypothetical protein
MKSSWFGNIHAIILRLMNWGFEDFYMEYDTQKSIVLERCFTMAE